MGSVLVAATPGSVLVGTLDRAIVVTGSVLVGTLGRAVVVTGSVLVGTLGRAVVVTGSVLVATGIRDAFAVVMFTGNPVVTILGKVVVDGSCV